MKPFLQGKTLDFVPSLGFLPPTAEDYLSYVGQALVRLRQVQPPGQFVVTIGSTSTLRVQLPPEGGGQLLELRF